MTNNVEIWDLEQILEGRSVEEILNSVNKDVDNFVKIRDKLSDDISGQEIRDAVLLKEKIGVELGKVAHYYSLKSAENTSDTKALAEITKLKEISSDISNKMVFFSLWFMKLDDKNANRIINSKEIGEYKHYLEIERKYKDHIRSEEVEQVLTLKNNTSGNAFAEIYEIMTNAFEFEWDGKKVTQEDVIKNFRSKDPEKRKKAYELVLGKYGDSEHSVMLSEIYKKIVQSEYNENIKIRAFKKPIDPRNLSNEIDDATVEVLLNVIRKNVDVFSEYFKIKYELNKKQGQEYEFSRYHLYAPYDVKLTEKYDYEASKKIVLETYKNFDERFYEAAKIIFDANHVHSHPQKNKRSGAFCSMANNTQLPYILLNHTNELRDLFTMMHEFGHGIHDVLSMKQPSMLQYPSIPMAETASTFGEMILADRLLKESNNDEEKKYILTYLLDNQYASIGRQAYFVLFEKYTHDNIVKGVTKEDMDTEYMSLLKEQFGSMDVPEVFKHEWNYIPHIHNSPFYCYSYAWGNLLVLSLYDTYRKEGKHFVDNYANMLATGGSKTTSEMLKVLGINPDTEEFWERGFKIIREEIENLKSL